MSYVGKKERKPNGTAGRTVNGELHRRVRVVVPGHHRLGHRGLNAGEEGVGIGRAPRSCPSSCPQSSPSVPGWPPWNSATLPRRHGPGWFGPSSSHHLDRPTTTGVNVLGQRRGGLRVRVLWRGGGHAGAPAMRSVMCRGKCTAVSREPSVAVFFHEPMFFCVRALP